MAIGSSANISLSDLKQAQYRLEPMRDDSSGALGPVEASICIMYPAWWNTAKEVDTISKFLNVIVVTGVESWANGRIFSQVGKLHIYKRID